MPPAREAELEMGRCIEDARFQIVLCGVEHAHVEDLNLRLDSGGAHLLAAQFQELGFVHKYHTVKPVHRTRVKRRHLGSELPEGADTLLPGEPLSSGGGQVEQHRAASGADQAHRLFKFVKAHAPRVVVVPDMYMYHGGPCLVAAQRCLGNLLWLGRKIRVILLGGDRAGEGGGDNHLSDFVVVAGGKNEVPDEVPDEKLVLHGNCTRKYLKKHPNAIHIEGCPPSEPLLYMSISNGELVHGKGGQMSEYIRPRMAADQPVWRKYVEEQAQKFYGSQEG